MGKAVLLLEDGFELEGEAFGAEGEAFGEVVFNTSITGYQEILTDPSYRGQIVTMTYPLIGNYGVNPEDAESARAVAVRVRRAGGEPDRARTGAPRGTCRRGSRRTASSGSRESTPGR